MKRFSRLLVGSVAASLFASPILARPGGGGAGGGGGGLVGGIVGGVTGTLSNALGGVGGAVGGTVNGALGGIRNIVGGVTGSGLLSGTRSGLLGGSGGGTVGGIGSVGSRGNLSGGGGTGSSGLSNMFTLRGPLGDIAALNQVSGQLGMESASPTEIESYREARLAALIAAYPTVLDRDNHGDPVRKREVIATNPDPMSLALAARAGFQLIGDESDSGLGIRLVTLAIPKRMNVRQAMKTIRRAAPGLQVDFNHVYEPSGGALLPVAGARLAAAAHHKPRTARAARAARTAPAPKPATRIAMIDGGIASHPSLAHANIVQQGFAGAAQATGHGTAVGSLLVGDQGPFRGAARGAELFVADVYGGNPAAGSVTSIVRALNWAASKNPSVINISLVGPENVALARAIAAVQARGIAVVAAVGNDGPAAPPQYPASYAGVVSVTGVDADGRALREAGVSKHLDFAAPGADMLAAYPGNGYLPVRGTSFAAPLAAARLALTGSYQRLVQEARPGEGRVGRGIVCGQCRVDPKYLRK